jgi:uncharacterized BrkB/YihY/UPF0761 family membrane protein
MWARTALVFLISAQVCVMWCLCRYPSLDAFDAMLIRFRAWPLLIVLGAVMVGTGLLLIVRMYKRSGTRLSSTDAQHPELPKLSSSQPRLKNRAQHCQANGPSPDDSLKPAGGVRQESEQLIESQRHDLRCRTIAAPGADRAILDFTKHLATIHSGAIAFLVAVLDKFAPDQKRLVLGAFVAFVAALVLRTAASGISLHWFHARHRRPMREHHASRVFFLLVIASGVLLMVGFALIGTAALAG